jgi:hypothetical protein
MEEMDTRRSFFANACYVSLSFTASLQPIALLTKIEFQSVIRLTDGYYNVAMSSTSLKCISPVIEKHSSKYAADMVRDLNCGFTRG